MLIVRYREVSATAMKPATAPDIRNAAPGLGNTVWGVENEVCGQDENEKGKVNNVTCRGLPR